MTSFAPDLPIGEIVDTHPAPRPERVTLRGRYVTLEPLDPAKHGDSIYAETHGPDELRIWQYMGDGPFADRAAFDASLKAKSTSNDPLFFAITDNATGRALGYQTLMRVDTVNRVIEVGNIVYGAGLQRTPAASEAQYLFAAYVFDTLGYRRYEWKLNNLNAPSKRAAERYGFTFEGVFRQHMIIKGRNRDTCWLAMLDHEWPRYRAAFEAWLNPSNFDTDGRQKKSLVECRPAMMMPNIRRAKRHDADHIVALQHDAYAPNRALIGAEPIPLQANYTEILSRDDVWVADVHGDIAGALILQPQNDHMLIWSIATASRFQRQGIANGLLDFAEQYARQLGFALLRLYTGQRLERNVAWYQRRGFQIDRIEQRPDRAIVHMSKKLT